MSFLTMASCLLAVGMQRSGSTSGSPAPESTLAQKDSFQSRTCGERGALHLWLRRLDLEPCAGPRALEEEAVVACPPPSKEPDVDVRGERLPDATLHLSHARGAEQHHVVSSRCVASRRSGRVDLHPMMTVAELKTKAVSVDIEVVQGGARVGRKAVEFAFNEEREEVPREVRAQPGYACDRSHAARPGAPKVVGLHPGVAAREGGPPVFLRVPPAPGEVDGLTVDCELTVENVIQADEAVVALHEGDEGVPPHHARREQPARPGEELRELERACKSALLVVDVELDRRRREVAAAEVESKCTPGGPKGLERELVILHLRRIAVDRLQEGVARPASPVERDARDERETAFLVSGDELMVPTLEVAFA